MPALVPLAEAGTPLITGGARAAAPAPRRAAAGEAPKPVFAGSAAASGRLPGGGGRGRGRRAAPSCAPASRVTRAAARRRGLARSRSTDGTALEPDAGRASPCRRTPPRGCWPRPRRPPPPSSPAIEYASMAIVTFAFRRRLRRLPPGSGLPGAAGRRALRSRRRRSPQKWPWLAHAPGELVVLRASVGRLGESESCSATTRRSPRLRAPTCADAVGLTARAGRRHVHALGRRPAAVRRRATSTGSPGIRARSPVPGLAVSGAAYDGVGIPACIASAPARRLPAHDHRQPATGHAMTDNERTTEADRRVERPVSEGTRAQRQIRYTSWSVFQAVRRAARGEGLRPATPRRSTQLFEEARGQGRRRARHLRRQPACAPTPT